jgi:hypothetical protein
LFEHLLPIMLPLGSLVPADARIVSGSIIALAATASSAADQDPIDAELRFVPMAGSALALVGPIQQEPDATRTRRRLQSDPKSPKRIDPASSRHLKPPPAFTVERNG